MFFNPGRNVDLKSNDKCPTMFFNPSRNVISESNDKYPIIPIIISHYFFPLSRFTNRLVLYL